MTHEISLAGRDDIPRIVELANWAARHTTANFATEPEPLEEWMHAWEVSAALHPWLVARVAGTVVGFAKSGPHRSRGAYRWTAEVSVYIDEAHHRRGVARALYQVLLPLLRRQGHATLLAGITAGHEPSERLHASSGFVRCGTFHRAGWKFGQWHDVGYWELQLQPAGWTPGPIQPVAEVWAGGSRTAGG
jgi:phosphinothricin acetyltransferase